MKEFSDMSPKFQCNFTEISVIFIEISRIFSVGKPGCAEALCLLTTIAFWWFVRLKKNKQVFLRPLF